LSLVHFKLPIRPRLSLRTFVGNVNNALSRQRYRRAAIQLLTSLHADPSIVIVSLSASLYQRAFQLFEERSDKEWGMTDCLSFVVMEERSVHEALTADHHFRQAGFRALLLEL